jgi:two-component system response regulator YesN
LVQWDKKNVSCDNWVFIRELKHGNAQTEFIVQYDQQINLWAEMLRHGSKEQVLKEISEVLEAWRGIEGLDSKLMNIFQQDFLQMIHSLLQEKEIVGYHALSELLSPEHCLAASRSVLHLHEWVSELVVSIAGYFQTFQQSQTVVDKIKLYVTHRIGEDFSRQDLADYFQLNHDYLVRLFKKETGTSISEYILEERMNKAINLLTRTNIPISEISLKVGYANFSYFSKVFKNTTSLNPQEFRKNHQIV